MDQCVVVMSISLVGVRVRGRAADRDPHCSGEGLKAFLTCMRRKRGDAIVSGLIMRSICLADIAQKPSELALLPA